MQWVFLKDPAVSTCDMHPQNLLESFQQLLSSSTYLTPFNGTSHATTPPPTSQNSGTETLDRRIGTFSCESQGCKRRQKHSPNSPLAQPNSPSQKACQMLSSAWFLDIPRPLILPIHLSLSLCGLLLLGFAFQLRDPRAVLLLHFPAVPKSCVVPFFRSPKPASFQWLYRVGGLLCMFLEKLLWAT